MLELMLKKFLKKSVIAGLALNGLSVLTSHAFAQYNEHRDHGRHQPPRCESPESLSRPIFHWVETRTGENYYSATNAPEDLNWGREYRPQGVAFSLSTRSMVEGNRLQEVLRLYNPVQGNFYLTANHAEARILVDRGWMIDGRLGWISLQPYGSMQQKIFRMYHHRQGIHFYTVDYHEVRRRQHMGWELQSDLGYTFGGAPYGGGRRDQY